MFSFSNSPFLVDLLRLFSLYNCLLAYSGTRKIEVRMSAKATWVDRLGPLPIFPFAPHVVKESKKDQSDPRNRRCFNFLNIVAVHDNVLRANFSGEEAWQALQLRYEVPASIAPLLRSYQPRTLPFVSLHLPGVSYTQALPSVLETETGMDIDVDGPSHAGESEHVPAVDAESDGDNCLSDDEADGVMQCRDAFDGFVRVERISQTESAINIQPSLRVEQVILSALSSVRYLLV
jgi:hypothetical protein